jgi:hypothetical protein
MKLGSQRVSARTDGGLQIQMPDGGLRLTWDRSYYELALEVQLFFRIELIVGKAIFCEEKRQRRSRETIFGG